MDDDVASIIRRALHEGAQAGRGDGRGRGVHQGGREAHGGQGLTLVHFSAQLEPFLTQSTPFLTPDTP